MSDVASLALAVMHGLRRDEVSSVSSGDETRVTDSRYAFADGF